MDRVKGKVAIITGGAGGLGSAQSSLLAKEGAQVVVADINKVQGEKVSEEINAAGGEAIFIRLDVTDEIQWRAAIDQTVDRFGKLDVLVNNAGVLIFNKIEDIPYEEWRRVISINLDGVFLGTKHAIGAMKKSGGGSIINISSTAGIIGGFDTSSYHASKAGVRVFTKSAALECSKAGYDYNIRINSVHPGVIETAMAAPLIEDEEKKQLALSWHPMGHFGKPEDIAYGVLYLASDESKFVTGSELVIDGGWTCH